MQLMQMLEDGIRYAPLYKPVYNSDHLPMTLCAMHGLGASDTALLAFKEEYEQRLHEWQPVADISHWQDGLGQRELFPALLAYFRGRLEAEDPESVVSEVLGHCLTSIALDAFHPVIRLGYGVDFGCRAEIAAGLAYVVSAHRDMPIGGEPVDLRQQVIEQSQAEKITLEANRFGPGVFELVERDLYPLGSADSFATLAGVALALYQSTRNFFALHLVTATQALRVCITDETQALGLSAMTSAILASHLILDRPPLSDEPLPAPQALDPEHALKYAWACLSEHQVHGNDEYLAEIDRFRQAGLVPSWAAADLFR